VFGRAHDLLDGMLTTSQASMQLSGLGPALWWVEPDEEPIEEEEEEADGGAEDLNGDAVDEMDEGA
jgi:DNA-directed RNA polymerase III subunit RPC8